MIITLLLERFFGMELISSSNILDTIDLNSHMKKLPLEHDQLTWKRTIKDYCSFF